MEGASARWLPQIEGALRRRLLRLGFTRRLPSRNLEDLAAPTVRFTGLVLLTGRYHNYRLSKGGRAKHHSTPRVDLAFSVQEITR